MVNDNKINKILQILIYNSYHKKSPIYLPEWQPIYNRKSISGFDGTVYQKGNTIVIVYNGTDGFADLPSDSLMYFGFPPLQEKAARRLYDDVKRNFRGVNIILTGHSLGGSLAQLVSEYSGSPAVTFNAYGTGKILKKRGVSDLSKLNIVNYGNPKDPIFRQRYSEQPGKTYFTNTNLDKNYTYKVAEVNNIESINIGKYHTLETMDNIDNSVNVYSTHTKDVDADKYYTSNDSYAYTGDNIFTLQGYITKSNLIQRFKNRLKGESTGYAVPVINSSHIYTPSEIGAMSTDEFLRNESVIMNQVKNGLIGTLPNSINYSGYINPITGSGKIYSREDIDAMSNAEFSEVEKAINAQMNSIGIPSNIDLEQSSISGGGTIYVNAYYRSDGTYVRGYYRAA